MITSVFPALPRARTDPELNQLDAPTRLCLVRHGETAWNADKRIQGQLDIPLNDNGRAQARATARGLAEAGIRAIYSSDLVRAHETGHTIGEELGLPVRPEARLRERHFGLFQRMTYTEAREQHPALWAHFESRDVAHRFEGGESLTDLYARVRAALEAIAQAHPGETVLVVSHGGVLDIAYRLATGRALDAPRDFLIPNAALNWLEWRAGRFSLHAWAQQAHLAGALDELPG